MMYCLKEYKCYEIFSVPPTKPNELAEAVYTFWNLFFIGQS